MKRVYAEMILKGVMAENSKDVVNNILDWMETIDDCKSDDFMDIITGVEKRNINIPKSIPESDIVEACNKEVRRNTNSVFSVTTLTTPFYSGEFATRPIVTALYMYEYKSNKKLSPEKAEEFNKLKKKFTEKYNNRIISNDERDQIDKEKSILYNFCSNNAYEGEDAVVVNRADYSTITVTL